MGYNLVITKHADELLSHLAYYLTFQLKNEQAATHFLDEVEQIYSRLEENPYQFPVSKDAFRKRQTIRHGLKANRFSAVYFMALIRKAA